MVTSYSHSLGKTLDSITEFPRVLRLPFSSSVPFIWCSYQTFFSKGWQQKLGVHGQGWGSVYTYFEFLGLDRERYFWQHSRLPVFFQVSWLYFFTAYEQANIHVTLCNEWAISKNKNKNKNNNKGNLCRIAISNTRRKEGRVQRRGDEGCGYKPHKVAADVPLRGAVSIETTKNLSHANATQNVMTSITRQATKKAKS